MKKVVKAPKTTFLKAETMVGVASIMVREPENIRSETKTLVRSIVTGLSMLKHTFSVAGNGLPIVLTIC